MKLLAVAGISHESLSSPPVFFAPRSVLSQRYCSLDYNWAVVCLRLSETQDIQPTSALDSGDDVDIPVYRLCMIDPLPDTALLADITSPCTSSLSLHAAFDASLPVEHPDSGRAPARPQHNLCCHIPVRRFCQVPMLTRLRRQVMPT